MLNNAGDINGFIDDKKGLEKNIIGSKEAKFLKPYKFIGIQIFE